MKIVVLVKQVPDTAEERKINPITGLLERDASESVLDEINERALEVALRYKDANKGTEVITLSMGPQDTTQALRKTLSMGADSAVHVRDEILAGSDAGWTSAVLAAAVNRTGFDLVVAGNESTDGRTGIVPAMVAEQLGLPMLGSLVSVDVAAQTVQGVRQGDGATLNVRASLPAVISVTERSADARFPSFKGIMSAKRKPITTYTLGDLGLTPAAVAQAGRAVVVSAAETPSRPAGTKIIDEGNAATELAGFLIAGRLV